MKQETVISRGERLKSIVDYDLFGNNTNGHSGIFLKKDKSSNKHLIYFPQFGEWAELLEEQFVRESPGTITEEDKSFIDNVKTLVYTFET